ncbi:MAG: OsmC family protein [Gemmatimonadaceae bacterium]
MTQTTGPQGPEGLPTGGAPSSTSTVREVEVQARSTDTFGRVLCSARDHHFIVDGPVQNGCPGEAVTPPELFLSSVASCGVELLHVIARDEGVPLRRVSVSVRGVVDRAKQSRSDVTLFNSVRLRFTLEGVEPARAAALVEGFKRR